MARTTLTKSKLSGSYTGASITPTITAGDASNLNQFLMSGGEIISVRNSGGSSRSITIKSATDPYGRSGDITESIPAGESRVYGPFLAPGWRQSDGYFYLDPGHADLLITILSPPF